MLKSMTFRCTLAAVACALSLSAHAIADSPRKIEITPGDLRTALLQLSRTFGVELLYQPSQLDHFRTAGVMGDYTPEAAVRQLLKGTPLELRTDPSGAMMVIDPKAPHAAAVSALIEQASASSGGADSSRSRSSLQLVQTTPGAGATAVAGPTPNSPANSQLAPLEEVVVTAQKRTERLMDIPASVGVLGGNALDSLHVQSLSDMADYVPGLSIEQAGSPGHTQVVIRGLSSGSNGVSSAPLVATLIDDVPVGASNGAAAAGAIGLDLAPYDLERIEVLRGPQGTLYGADSMGGIVKYVLRKPDLTQFDASAGGDIYHINESAGAAESARGSVSMPILADTLAIRIAAFYQHEPGYIDNIGAAVSDSNTMVREGGRATLLWVPTSGLTLQATYIDDQLHQDDATGVTVDATTEAPIYGPQARSTNLLEPFSSHLHFADVNIAGDVGFATLTSSSSWSRHDSTAAFSFGNSYNQYQPANADGISLFNGLYSTSKYTEELRLTSRDDQKLSWMLGTYLTREESYYDTVWNSYTPNGTLFPPVGSILLTHAPVFYREWAVFGNATYKLTDRWDVTGGVRYASNWESSCRDQSDGIFGLGSAPCSDRPYQSNTTWLGAVTFHINADAMLYARVATGYRPGGGCTGCGNPRFGVPDYYYPDTVTNYETGLKGQFLDKRLQFDMSLFYIDWKNMQVLTSNQVFVGYITNTGGAISKGLELSAAYQATKNLNVTATLDYTNAYLTTDTPLAGGKSGDQLPESPHWTASVIGNYARPLGNDKSFLLGGDYRYRDTTFNGFPSSTLVTTPPLPMSPQNLFGLYTGLEVDRIRVRLYAKNVFNNRSYTGELYLQDPQRPMLNPVQPRTIGLSADYRFR
jgi:iron complex outermembrane receptor protein